MSPRLMECDMACCGLLPNKASINTHERLPLDAIRGDIPAFGMMRGSPPPLPPRIPVAP